ncbi:MAG: homocysteine S-methyltransferase family protein [Christensenellaceae bacterium]|jgi:methionine synthase I (cobalamin-dependent)
MSKFIRKLSEGVMLYDGAKATVLQGRGLQTGECAEYWNIKKPEAVEEAYRSYIDAGSDLIQTNTFCANSVFLKQQGLYDKLYEINYEGAALALACAKGRALVAAAVGPLAVQLYPKGELCFEDAVATFKEQLRPLLDAGISIVHFETFTNLAEMRAAVIAARELGVNDIIASMVFSGGKTACGNTPETCAITCEAAGAQVVGANCMEGEDELLQVVRSMKKVTDLPIVAKPSAGLPEMQNGQMVYPVLPEEFAKLAETLTEEGVRLFGGCCGTGPVHIQKARGGLNGKIPAGRKTDVGAFFCSAREHTAFSPNIRLAELGLCNSGLIENIKDGDYYCLMDALPDRTEQADALLLNFEDAKLDFDVASFCAALATYSHKPVVVNAVRTDVAEAFLRYYCGRAGVIGPADIYDAYGAFVMSGF